MSNPTTDAAEHQNEVKQLGVVRRWVRSTLLKALNKAVDWAEAWGRPKRLTEIPELLVLSPKYEEAKHGLYIDLIEDALSKPESGVFNIALTGGYGVGKSSILSEVAKRHKDKVIAISLSTLGFAEDEPQPSSDVAKAASTKTNRIQKEIVKQLLYSERPGKMPGSSYRRATRLPFWRMTSYATLVGVIIAVVFLLTSWGVTGATMLGVQTEVWIVTLVIVVGAAVAAFPILALFYHRFQLSGVEAGGATISLSSKSATYFDEYLDEIVYFFEVVDRDIIIFEDIDRFDDPHIFEALRSLNSILNNARQLRGRRIRFIYAVKDSIFDRLGLHAKTSRKKSRKKGELVETDAEAARANRTKFFDVVIPVVPFITHRSARDLLDTTLGELNSDELKDIVDVAAKHLADMRLIKNIRNEYIVFKAQVLDHGQLELKADHLLAMVLYKSTHLGDFELIKLGDSNLDILYRESRDLVEKSLVQIELDLRDARRKRRLTSIPAERAAAFGDALVKYVERVLRHGPPAYGTLSVRSWLLDGNSVSAEQLRSADFWHRYADSAEPLVMSAQRSTGGTFDFQFTQQDVAAALRTKIDPVEVIGVERERLDGIIAKLENDRSDLSKADMPELVQAVDYTLEVDGEKLTFDELIERRLKSPLARDLVRGGFFDRNFTLYTSPFYDTRLSAAATNFVMKNVNRNSEEFHFKLRAKDAGALIDQLGYSFLDGPAGRNIHIADYLLASDQDGVAHLVKNLLGSGEAGTNFILSYLGNGAAPEKLIAALTPKWSSVISFVVTEANAKDDLRLRLLDEALSTLAPDVDYDVADEEVGIELSNSYAELAVFKSEKTTAAQSQTIAITVKRAEAEIANLQLLSKEMRQAAVKQRIYSIDRRNLMSALERGDDLSLDAIARTEVVYEHVLANVTAYLELLKDDEPTVVDAAALPGVINDLMAADPSQLEAVVSRAAAGCVVADIEDLEDYDAAPTLARLGRFAPTFNNITAYLAWSDEVDVDLVTFLSGIDKITDAGEAEEVDKEKLALQIIASDAVPADRRAKLTESLRLEEWLDVDQIAPEFGALYGELIDRGVIKDDAESFARLNNSGWEARQHYIIKSDEFKKFVSPEVVGGDLGRVLNDTSIDVAVKAAILANVDAYAQISERPCLVELARHAADAGASVSIDTVLTFAQARVLASTVLSLLRPLLQSASLEGIAPILVALGGEYVKLAGKTGKKPLIDKTADTEALITRLDDLGVVASVAPVGKSLRVHMRKPK